MWERYETICERKHMLKVVAFNKDLNCHECKFNDTRVYVDLLVNGDFDESTKPEDLVGETVAVGWSHGFLWIGHEVSIQQKDSE